MRDKKDGIPNDSFINDEDFSAHRRPVAGVGDTMEEKTSLAQVEAAKELSPERVKREKFAIWKNVILISFAFLLIFTDCMAELQSSLNKTDGTYSLAMIYVALVISCCFVSSWLIKKLKTKHTMALCMLGYAFYQAAQCYARYYTLIPAAIIMGLAAAPMWSAKCTYFTKVGLRYAELTGEDSEVIITRFFGVFFLFFQSNRVWGNLMGSSVLSMGTVTLNKTDEEYNQCGYNFCPTASKAYESEDTETHNNIPLWKIYTLAITFLIMIILGSLVVFFLVDPLSKFADESSTINSGKSSKEMLMASFHHMRHPYQVFIIPLTIWSGVEQAFVGADITAAYVTCGAGIHMVGYTLICHGLCDSIFSLVLSRFMKHVGRIFLFTSAFILNLSLIILCILWTPRHDNISILFVLTGLWGTCDAVWQTQINALYGVLFPNDSEVAFSNYRLWESLGFFLAFAFSSIFCIDDKIIVLFFFLFLGMAGYYAIEVVEKKGGLKKDKEGKVILIDKIFSRRKQGQCRHL